MSHLSLAALLLGVALAGLAPIWWKQIRVARGKRKSGRR